MPVRKSGSRGKNVKVKPYRRKRFGVIENVTPHKRGPRSKSPGGYNTGAQSRRKRKGRRGNTPKTTTSNR